MCVCVCVCTVFDGVPRARIDIMGNLGALEGEAATKGTPNGPAKGRNQSVFLTCSSWGFIVVCEVLL